MNLALGGLDATSGQIERLADAIANARTRGITVTAARRGTLSGGRFRLGLPLPRSMRSARSGVLTVRYGGDARFRPRTLRTRVRRG